MTVMMGMPVPSAQASAMLFQRYQANQNLIAKRVADAVDAFWIQLVDPAHFSDSWRRLEPIVSGIVDTHYSMSASDAADYYGLSRAVSGFAGDTVPGASLDSVYLNTVVNARGVGQFYHHLDGGMDAALAADGARNSLRGASIRLVMNGGRDTVTGAAAGDDIALGWERIIEFGSCGYCSRLAASGGVRKAESTEFHAHDSCQCLARVVFQGQSSVNADLASQWSRVTAGRSRKDAIASWNHHWSDQNGSNSTTNTGQGAAVQATAPQEEAGNAAVIQ
jgi:hypothetical protein